MIRRFLVSSSGLVLAICLGCLDAGVRPQIPTTIPPPNGHAQTPSLATSLHMHGWSNHAGAPRPGSMAWQTQQVAQAGVQVLWWTDHSDIYAPRVPDLVVVPSVTTSLEDRLWSVGTWGPGNQGRALLWSNRSSATVGLNGSILEVQLPPTTSVSVDTIRFSLARWDGTASRHTSFPVLSRALIGDPHIRWTVWRDQSDSTYPDLRVLAPLSWHPQGTKGSRQVLEYWFRDGATPDTTARGDTLVFSRPWPGGDSTNIDIQPRTDAGLLSDGLDNAIDEYQLTFQLNNGPSGHALRFSLPTMSNTESSIAAQMDPAVARAHAIGDAAGVRTIWGLEVGATAPALAGTHWDSLSGGGRHLALYLPSDIASTFVARLPGSPAGDVQYVHSAGGVVSIAHPFGVTGTPPAGPPEMQRGLVNDLGNFLVENHAWGADVIEIGTAPRGGAGIIEHLWLLDYLLASGIRICADGVSDSHGGQLEADPQPGTVEQWNSITWIGGVTIASPIQDLVSAMRTCRTSFGNPFYVAGGMWITAERDSSGQMSLSLDLDGVTPNAGFYVVEGEIDSTGVGHPATYRQYEVKVERGAKPKVGGCRPGFARLEAWASNRAMAFSNVVFLPAQPERCSP